MADIDGGKDKRFERPVTIEIEAGKPVIVRNTRQAAECLLMQWPSKRGPRHRDAVDACLKVLDGHRSAVDAQGAFLDAAKEAGILVDEHADIPQRLSPVPTG